MNTSSTSSWTNPLSLTIVILVALWVFSLIWSCNRTEPIENDNPAVQVASPLPGYQPLPEQRCPLRLAASDGSIAEALLQQYFRQDSLTRLQEAVWQPDPELDPVFHRLYEGNWETYIECIQTLGRSSEGEDKIAIMVSNFPDNDCQACAPYIGYIRFSIQRGDPATIVIRDSERSLFTFGAYGAVGDQISLVQLGADQWGLAFSTAHTGQGYTMGQTTIYDVNDFRPLVRVNNYETNGGTDDAQLYERKGQLFYRSQGDTLSRPDLALYQVNTPLNGDNTEPSTQVIYYHYVPDSSAYVVIQ